MNENILELVKAGFTADEIRIIAPEAFAPASIDSPHIDPPAPADPAPAAASAAPEPDAAPADPAPAAAPATPEATAPAWFTDFVRQNNEDIAQLQRALQVTNVRRADQQPAAKTQEQLMAEAFRGIID